MPFNFSSSEFLSHNKTRKNRVSPVSRASPAHMNSPLAVLPTGFGKSLVYQILAPIFDYLNCGMEPDDKQKSSLVIVVSPLNALIQDQISKLSDKISVCVAKAERVISVDKRDRKASQRLSLDGIPSNCQILFAHPEAVIEMRDIRSTSVQRKVKAIIVDEAHLVVQW